MKKFHLHSWSIIDCWISNEALTKTLNGTHNQYSNSSTSARNKNSAIANFEVQVKLLTVEFLIMTALGTTFYMVARFVIRQPQLSFHSIDTLQLILCLVMASSELLALVGAFKKRKSYLVPFGFALFSMLMMNLLYFCYIMNQIQAESGNEWLTGENGALMAMGGVAAIFISSGLSAYTLYAIFHFHVQLSTNSINKEVE